MDFGARSRSRRSMAGPVVGFGGLVFLGAVVALPGAEPERGTPDRERIAGAETLRWSFDGDTAGKPPAGWTFAQTNPSKTPAAWEVAAEPTAPTRPNVLSVVKSESGGGTFNLAMVEKAVFKDLDLSVKLRANAGKEEQGGGLVWRTKDEKNYYLCRLSPLEAKIRLHKVVDGKRLEIASADLKAEAGKWYTLRIVMRGDAMACFLDGKQLLEARDADFKERGRIGLWTRADAASSFDDLVARHADPITQRDGDAGAGQGPVKPPPPVDGPPRAPRAKPDGKR